MSTALNIMGSGNLVMRSDRGVASWLGSVERDMRVILSIINLKVTDT